MHPEGLRTRQVRRLAGQPQPRFRQIAVRTGVEPRVYPYQPGLGVDADEATVKDRVEVGTEQEAILDVVRPVAAERHDVGRLKGSFKVAAGDRASPLVSCEQAPAEAGLPL